MTTITRTGFVLAMGLTLSWAAIVACSPGYDGSKPFEGKIDEVNARAPGSGDGGAREARAPEPPDGSATATKNPDGKDVEDGKANWLFNGYCGNDTLGKCEPGLPDCEGAADAITETSCGHTLDRCLGPANDGNARKTYLCTEKASQAWVFNGYCDSDPTVPCTPGGGKPACVEAAPVGKECPSPSTKCVTGSSIFVCIPGGKTTWITSGHCGVTSAGEKSCADGAQPVCKDTYGGKPCDPQKGTRCQSTSSGSEAGKIFSCVAR